MNELLIVETTCGSESEAKNLSKNIVEKKLGACVQISEISSTYCWEDSCLCESEWLVRIKTTSHCLETLKTYLLESHPYEVPEIIYYSAKAGNPDYSEWLKNQTQ